MADITTIKRIAELHPRVRPELPIILTEIQAKGIDIRIAQGFRSFAEQDALYAKGRTDSGHIVTNARGGESYHCWGLAIDFCLLHKDGSISWDLKEDTDKDKEADWMEVVDTFMAHGWESGMFWKRADNPHFEKKFGLNFKQLALLPKDGNGYVIFPI